MKTWMIVHMKRFPYIFLFSYTAICFIFARGISSMFAIMPGINEVKFLSDGISLPSLCALVFGFTGGLLFMMRNS